MNLGLIQAFSTMVYVKVLNVETVKKRLLHNEVAFLTLSGHFGIKTLIGREGLYGLNRRAEDCTHGRVLRVRPLLDADSYI